MKWVDKEYQKKGVRFRQKEIPGCWHSSFNLNATDIKFTTLPHYTPQIQLLWEMCLPEERDATTAAEREGSTNRGSWRTGFVFAGGSAGSTSLLFLTNTQQQIRIPI